MEKIGAIAVAKGIRIEDAPRDLNDHTGPSSGREWQDKPVGELSLGEARALIQELRAHHMELEIRHEELLRSKRALEQDHDRFKDLYDFAPIGYLTVRRDGRITDANVTAAHMLRTPRVALAASRLQRFVVGSDQSVFLAHRRALFDHGERQSCEIRMAREDESTFDARLDSVPQGNDQGRLTHFRTTVIDLTASKQAERQWRLSEAILESAGLALLVLDPDHRIVRVNRAFSEMTGHSPDAVHGESAERFLASEGERNVLEALWLHLQGEDRWSGELWCRRRSGEPFPARMTIATIRNDLGALTHYAALLTDITEMKRAEEQMRHRAYYDSVTGLPNRVLFHERLSAAVREARRRDSMVGLLFIDLDCFKHANDRFGHATGDELLRAVATRLNGCVRENDTVGRIGGDEFGIVLADLGEPRSAAVVAEKITVALSSSPVVTEGNVTLSASASTGIALYPKDSRDLDTLYRYADMAMYRAKGAGGRTYRFFARNMTQEALAHIRTQRELAQALERGELELHYQPVFRCTDGTLAGAEALLRWRHPSRGLLSADSFLRMAEDSGQLQPISEWAIHTACHQAAAWQGLMRGRELFLAINLAARQLHRGDGLQRTVQLLADTGMADRLVMEINEGHVAGTAGLATDLRAFKGIGVRLAMDDFGTGLSSLGYLKRLSFDMLKIDRSVVHDAERCPQTGHMVEALLSIARGLRLQVVAEGVEAREDLDFLRERGCDYVQGNLLGPPMPREELERLLKGNDDGPAEHPSRDPG